MAPTTGRLYHYLVILTRPNVIIQSFYYPKSLYVPIPVNIARDLIFTFFEPIIIGLYGKSHAVDYTLVRCYGTFLTGKSTENFEKARKKFISNFDLVVAKGARRWFKAGY